MDQTLKTILNDRFGMNPTNRLVTELERFCTGFEIRSTNPLVLNTPLLGVDPMFFLKKDVSAIFDICGINMSEFDKAIKDCKAIDQKWKTISSSLNVLAVWLVHRFLTSDLSIQNKKKGSMAILKLMHYRVFTGRVGKQFPHGTNKDVMTATIDGLSGKSDIKRKETSTWKLMIEDHCERVYDKNSLHYKTFETFRPDDKVFYAISDMVTRLSSKIVVISEVYYKNHAAGVSIGQSDSMTTNQKGERELNALKSTLDEAINTLCSTTLNMNNFINHNYVKLACALSFNVRPDMLREVLATFSAVATAQYRTGKTQETKTSKGKTTIYVGYRLLLTELIQKTFRRCVLEGTVDMKSHVAILQRTRDIYRSSRINDPAILSIKESVDYFVQTNTKYTREATLVSLRSALILYLMISVLSQ